MRSLFMKETINEYVLYTNLRWKVCHFGAYTWCKIYKKNLIHFSACSKCSDFFFGFFCAVLHTFLNPCFFHCDLKTHMHTAKQTRLWQWLYDLWLVFSEMDMLILYRTFQTYETFMILLLVSNFVLLFRLYFLMVQTRNIVWSYRKDVFYDFSAESHKNVNE